ncbi:response regulator (plasmid) [Caballeronia sp. NK8]|uniref:hybrid sensor histidine kinase/response regulator n=1 Tax=Caballeronia sp. NK8 TaxID=140098 RepID=UPI001BB60FBF|nr:ATP-binding protein [Caballeronia sp. NK8]BCQ29071.1 response regulator [Caballeronia sp. NK8]
MNDSGPLLSFIGAAFDRAPCGLLTTTTEGLILRANVMFYRWTGYSPDELVGKRRFQDLLTIGGKVFHQTHWAPLLQMQRSVSEVKLDILHRNGAIVPVLINVVRQPFEGVDFDEFAVLVVADRHKYEHELLRARHEAEEALEAKRAAQDALEMADRRKDEFLATLAHELRNPLASIAGVAAVLYNKNYADPELTWSRDALQRQIGHIDRLVDDLLDVSRIAEGKIELRRQTVELITIMHQAVEGSRANIDASSHELIVCAPGDPIFLDADPVRLTQIIQNLLNNAAKYTPTQGCIHLTAMRDGKNAVVSVRDNGIGIAPEDLGKIFEIFSQLTPGLQRSRGGLGIGLSLVRAMTTLMGGTVSVRSDGVGHGSEFVVQLPALNASTESAPHPMAAAKSGVKFESRRVVIIDDDNDSTTSLAMVLEAEGHAVRTAATGQAGIKLIAAFDPHTVILDITLPDISGYEVMQSVRATKRAPGLLAIALTGWGQSQDKERAITAGFDVHFTKPIDMSCLLTLLQDPDSASVEAG